MFPLPKQQFRHQLLPHRMYSSSGHVRPYRLVCLLEVLTFPKLLFRYDLQLFLVLSQSLHVLKGRFPKYHAFLLTSTRYQYPSFPHGLQKNNRYSNHLLRTVLRNSPALWRIMLSFPSFPAHVISAMPVLHWKKQFLPGHLSVCRSRFLEYGLSGIQYLRPHLEDPAIQPKVLIIRRSHLTFRLRNPGLRIQIQ